MLEEKNEYKRSFGETLDAVIDKLPSESVNLETVLNIIGQEGLLLFCIFLTIPCLVPVTIPGVSTVFGPLILLIGLSVIRNRNVWLPQSLMQKSFSVEKLRPALKKGAALVHRVERFSHPRLGIITNIRQFNGLMLIIAALLLMAPLPLIPFSNTLPALTILFLSLGIMQKDGLCIILGHGLLLGTIVYFTIIMFGGVIVLQKSFGIIKRSFY